MSICPHLGTATDPQTFYSYPSPAGCCYAVREPGPVRMDHQFAACLTPRHTDCPIYQANLEHTADSPLAAFTPTRPIPASLPPELVPLAPEEDRRSMLLRWPLLLAVLAIGAALVLLLYNLPGNAIPLSDLSELLSRPSVRQPAAPTPQAPAAFDAGPSTPAAAAPEPALPIAGTPVIPTTGASPTAALAQLPAWILHTVETGETVAALAETYATTPAVLQAVNPDVARRVQTEADLRDAGVRFEEGYLWPGTLLVIYPGLEDPDGLVPLQAVNLAEPAALEDAAAALGLTPAELLRWNPDAPGTLPAGTWLVAPAPEP